MGTLLFYIFKSTLCLCILYLLFRLFFRTDTLFRTNRLVLLIGTMVCMLLPLLQIGVSQYTPLQLPITAIQNFLTEKEVSGTKAETVGEEKLTVAMVTPMIGEQTVRQSKGHYTSAIPVAVLLGGCYLAGVAVVFISLLLSTIRMRRLISRYQARDFGNYKLVVCPEEIVSFSWGKTIVLSQEDFERNPGEILLHEQMHLQHRHTADLLWMECIVILHWFNPAAWLLMRELREVHEYEADNGVINYGIDATQYQLLLVKKSVGTRLYSMACGFNHSKLKNRITMMLKRRTNRWARLKLLLFVPVAAATLYAFGRPEVKKTVEQVMEPAGVKQNSVQRSELEQLEAFFERKREDASEANRINKSVEPYAFFINMNNKMMLCGEFVADTEALSARLADLLKKDYQKAAKENRAMSSSLNVRYDRGASAEAITSCLRAVKEAYQQVRRDISEQSGGISEDRLDSMLPIVVNISDPQIYSSKYKTAPDKSLPVEVTFYPQDGGASSVLRNPTLRDIELKTKALKAADVDKMGVGLKFDKSASMAVVQDVREVIRKTLYGK